MRNANKSITLYNFYPTLEDPNVFQSDRTYIEGVSVYASTKVVVSKEGLSSANLYTIRIPEASVKGKDFALNKGDKIVLGFAEDESPSEPEIERKYGRDAVVTITGVTDNRGKREPHWKVTGE